MPKASMRFAAIVGLLAVLGSVALMQALRLTYTKYTDSFFDTFDTVAIVVAYTRSKAEFEAYFNAIRSRLRELHKMYDIYHTYEGMNNLKTINDNAGISPVKVDREIIDLIIFAKDWHALTGGQTNIALGPVLRIWHDYRNQAIYDPSQARVPPMEDLVEARIHTDLDMVIVDTENSTVYLADPHMSLDVGAVAKGYAVELVTSEIMAQGLQSGMISVGGNVRAIGKPLDRVRERWGVAIQDPRKSILSDDDGPLDVVFINDASVVSSGDYQRYYTVDGRVLHHLIDPKTLMPADHYQSVTIVTKDSGIADFVSTAAFLLPHEESRRLVDSLYGVEALWVMPDGSIQATDGMRKIMRSHGASGANRG